jgi:hypothetical protein
MEPSYKALEEIQLYVFGSAWQIPISIMVSISDSNFYFSISEGQKVISFFNWKRENQLDSLHPPGVLPVAIAQPFIAPTCH